MKKLITILLVAQCINATSQDFHLTNYDLSPQYLNPALTGVFDSEDFNCRVNANYRGQWSSLNGSPFRTITIGSDVPYGRFGVGFYILGNHAGNASISTNTVMFSGSYQVMSNTKEHSLTAGFQMGLINKNLNSSGYLFDRQYNASGGGIDPSLPSGESFSGEILWKFDAAMGVFYKLLDKTKKAKPYGGVSFYHITRPNQSFYEKNKTPIRLNLHGGCEITIDEKLEVTPGLLYMRQAKASEFNLNAIGAYKINETDFKVLGGLGWRNKDAIMIIAGLKQKANIYRLSYDVNTSSPLNDYSRGRGAFELGVIYMVEVKKLRGKSQL